MSERVIIGKHPETNKKGIWVSKPGKSALSNNDSDYLINTNRINSQPILVGSSVEPTLTYTSTGSVKRDTYGLGHPGSGRLRYIKEIPFGFDLGYTPLCFVSYSSSGGGDPYPSVYAKNDRLVLEFYMRQGVVETTQNGYDVYFSFEAPDTYKINATIHYVVFRQNISDIYTSGSNIDATRVVISSKKIKCSRDGYDVNKTTRNNLSFDIDFDDTNQPPYSGVYIKGTSASNDGTWSSVQINNVFAGEEQITRKYKVINFGKTFSKPPQVLYSLRNLSSPSSGAYQRYSAIDTVTNGTIGTVAWVSVSETALTLRIDYNTYGSTFGARNWEFSYVVFQS